MGTTLCSFREKGKLPSLIGRGGYKTVISYPLLNKDLIQFAHRSSKVRKMLIDGERVEAIRLYITGTKFRNITGDPELTDVQVLIITELLDEMSPKGVFKEFNSEIRKSLKAAK